jgi:hypothetical protein
MYFRSKGKNTVIRALNEGIQAMNTAVQTSTADQFNACTRSPVEKQLEKAIKGNGQYQQTCVVNLEASQVSGSDDAGSTNSRMCNVSPRHKIGIQLEVVAGKTYNNPSPKNKTTPTFAPRFI